VIASGRRFDRGLGCSCCRLRREPPCRHDSDRGASSNSQERVIRVVDPNERIPSFRTCGDGHLGR